MPDHGRNHTYFFASDREWTHAPDGLRFALFSTSDGDPEQPLSVLSEYPPYHCVPPHTHASDYLEIVIAGELTVGKVQFSTGDVRVMKGGGGYGPLTAGPAGCQVLTVFDRAGGSAPKSLGSS